MKRKKRSKTIGNANEYILKIAIGISLFVLLAASAGALNLYGAPQAISISPTEGPAGTVETITGTGWKYPGENNESVPIWIGVANEVARGYPDTNGNFSASAKIPLDSPPGQLTLAAIVGNGGSADAYFNVTAGPTPIPTASVTPTVNQPSENCVAVEGTNCSTIPSSGSSLR